MLSRKSSNGQFLPKVELSLAIHLSPSLYRPVCLSLERFNESDCSPLPGLLKLNSIARSDHLFFFVGQSARFIDDADGCCFEK